MKNRWYLFMSAFSILMLISLLNAPCSAGPALYCVPVSGTAPGIDGVYNLSQWPASPQLTITNPIQTNFYCMNDSTNLYILVDALGDTTDDNNNQPTHDACSASNIQNCDECLLLFSNPGDTTIFTAEVWGMAGSGNIIGSHLPDVNTQVSIGFNGHRFYEWMIPLTSINAAPGQPILFSSPRVCKSVGDGGSFCSSMPYDGFDGRDNEWPSGVDYDTFSTWGELRFGDPLAIPTMNEWGMIIFTILAGAGAVYYLKRRKRAEN